jgi:hypothetical protein
MADVIYVSNKKSQEMDVRKRERSGCGQGDEGSRN